jgi:nicotinate-nucleotide adenylyltransferase
MLKAALADEPRFQVDERELRRNAPSYSFDTLAELRSEHPHERLVLALGQDAFLGFTTWHRWKELLELTHLVIAHRPGCSLEDQVSRGEIAMLVQEREVDDAEALTAEPAGRLMFLPVTQLEISSSAIRETAAQGGELRYLVPDPVRRLIQDSHCYG